jgi:hypothetical protein
MTEGILIATIPSLLSLIGVIVTVLYGNKKTAKATTEAAQKTEAAVKEHTDVTLYRIQQLEKKQDIHNGVIERVYNLETNVALLIKSNDEITRKLNDLEEYHKEKK